MEYLTAPLARPSTGDCASCPAKNVPLTKAVVQVEDHPTRRNGMKQPIKLGLTANLICDSCSTTNPMWRDDIEPETQPAAMAEK